MITFAAEVQAAWRWYYLLLMVRARPVAGVAAARNAAAYACSALFGRAVLGRPTAYGPHQHADAMMWTDLTTNQQAAGHKDRGDWDRSSVRLLPLEAGRLCKALGQLYALGQASELGAVARLTIQDSVLVYDPLLGRWTDGFGHRQDEGLMEGTLHRIELSLDDPDTPAPDWERVAREYADGELHRHLGWTQGAEAQEVDEDGQQAAEVRDRCVPDQARANDQVEGQRPDRVAVPGQGARPGAHDAHPVVN